MKTIPGPKEAALINPMGVPSRAYRDFRNIIQYAENHGFPCLDYTTFSDTPRNRAESFNRALGSRASFLFPAAGNRYGDDMLHRINTDLLDQLHSSLVTFSAGSTLLPLLDRQNDRLSFYGPHLRFVMDDEGSGDAFRGYYAEQFWKTLQQSGSEPNTVTLHNTLPESQIGRAIPTIHAGEDNAESTVQGNVYPMFLESLARTVNSGQVTSVKNKILLLEADNITFSNAVNLLRGIHAAVDLRRAAALCITAITPHHKTHVNQIDSTELYSQTAATKFVDSVRTMLDGATPVSYGFPMGHGPHKATVPFDHPAQFNFATNSLTYTTQGQ